MGQIVASVAYAHGKKVADIPMEAGSEWAKKPDHFVWIGLQNPSPEQLHDLQRQFGLHELALEDALDEHHHRPKLESFGDALFMVLHAPVGKHSECNFVETHIFAGKGYVITARHGNSSSYQKVRERCEARPILLEHGEDFVIYAILDFVVDNHFPIIETIHTEIEAIEQRVLRGGLTQSDVERAHHLRRELLRLKRLVGPMEEICRELEQLDFPFIDKHMRPYFRDVAIHVKRLLDDIATLREMASHALEMGLLLESSRQSLVQRKFAAWAAILAFPTAVAGIYGMNFENMPELQWKYGYFMVLGIIAFGCVGLYASFKRSGWL